MQLTVGVVLSAASAVVSLAVAEFARRRSAPGARGVALFSGAAALWAAGNAVQVAVTSLDVKLLAVNVQYVGIVVLPVAWFVFAAEYTGREEWVNRRTVGALSVVPAVVLVLVWTNDAHHLVRVSATLDRSTGVARVSRKFGPVFWIAVAYANAVNAVGTVMLIEAAIRVQRHYRRQTAVVLAGATVPWLANVAYLAGTTTIESEAFVGVTAAAFGYAIARYELFDLVPVARDRVLEDLDDGVVVVDGDGRVADHNPAAERLLGADIATGDRAADVLPDAVWERPEGDSDPVAFTVNGEQWWLTVQARPVSESAPGDVFVVQDVTELERQRRELDRQNARLERVADTISHDLRNPLNVAEGYLELAEETGNPEHFERVQRSLDRMDDIVEGTLRMARTDLHSPEVTDVPLAAAAEAAWQSVPTGDASLRVDAGDAVVRADSDQLESLLENVFRNSVEHADGDGGVTVTVGASRDGFYVADDGPGIPEDVRERAFERGYTTSDTGTGLGLAIVSDVADAHDWRVDLGESEPGGARVDVSGVHVERGARVET